MDESNSQKNTPSRKIYTRTTTYKSRPVPYQNQAPDVPSDPSPSNPSPGSLQSLTDAVSADILSRMPLAMMTIKDRYRSDASKKESEEQYNDDVGSDAEGNTERPRCSTNIGASIGRGPKSFIDSTEDYGDHPIANKNRIFNKIKKDVNNRKSDGEYGVEGKRKYIDLQVKDRKESKVSAKQQSFKAEYVSINLSQKKSDPNLQTIPQDMSVIERRMNNSQMIIRPLNESSNKNDLRQKHDLGSRHNKVTNSGMMQKQKIVNSESIQNRKSSVCTQNPGSEIKKLNQNLKSFNPTVNVDVRSDSNQISHKELNKEPQFSIIASKSSINTPIRTNKMKNANKKSIVRQSDPSPIVFNNNDNSDFTSSSKRNQKHIGSNNIININSHKSPPVVIYTNSNQESNEGKLIRKLGERQKMIEKYETMLKKVNLEFQNTLNKNKELNDEISLLEMRLQRSEEKQGEIQGKIDLDRYSLQRQLDELILEKDDLINDNVTLNKLIKNKNYEIDELKKENFELQNRVYNVVDNIRYNNDSELRLINDELQKRVSELEFELKRRNESMKNDSTNIDLLFQSQKKEIEQLTVQRNELTDQVNRLKEQIWKDNLSMRQVSNENENLKRENNNLRSTIELIHDNEKEIKAECSYLREASLSHERKNILYQNIITQSDEYDINLIQSLERNLSLLRSSDALNKGLVCINIEKMIDELRSYRFKVKSKIDNNQVSGGTLRLTSTQSEYCFNPLSMSHDNFHHNTFDLRTELNSVKEENDSSFGNQNASISRSANKRDRIDPTLMQPAGIKSSKTKTFNNKYAAHYVCEIGSLKDFSP